MGRGGGGVIMQSGRVRGGQKEGEEVAGRVYGCVCVCAFFNASVHHTMEVRHICHVRREATCMRAPLPFKSTNQTPTPTHTHIHGFADMRVESE